MHRYPRRPSRRRAVVRPRYPLGKARLKTPQRLRQRLRLHEETDSAFNAAVNVSPGTQRTYHTSVDGAATNHHRSEAHVARELQRQEPESVDAADSNDVTRSRGRPLERIINRQTAAQERRCLDRIQSFGHRYDGIVMRDHRLGITAINGNAGNRRVGAASLGQKPDRLRPRRRRDGFVASFGCSRGTCASGPIVTVVYLRVLFSRRVVLCIPCTEPRLWDGFVGVVGGVGAPPRLPSMRT
jgi:hypothetical protein